MSNNVISNQGEIKTVINEVNTKTQEVIAAIREYNWMLQRLQSLAIKDDLINAGAVYENKDVVVCENLVTSRRPDDLPFFMKEFIKMIYSF